MSFSNQNCHVPISKEDVAEIFFVTQATSEVELPPKRCRQSKCLVLNETYLTFFLTQFQYHIFHQNLENKDFNGYLKF